MRDTSDDRSDWSVAHLGGWLFADLLLAAMIIFLAATPGAPLRTLATLTPTPSPTPSPIPTATPTAASTSTWTPTATPSSTPTATPTAACLRTAALRKYAYQADNAIVDGARTIPTIDQLRRVFDGVTNKRAGLVLTYVHAPGDGEGQHLSTLVNQRLTQAHPELFTEDTIYEDFDYKDRNPTNYGKAEFEIYYVSNECGRAG